jgi:alpha-tubulin suppressor-like RCC1 family protein
VAPGDVWDWGADYTYQLGDGTNGVRYAPVRPFGVVGTGSLTGVTAVAGGEEWVIVLRSDGTVVGYGGDSIGALGDGTQGQVPCYCRKTPVQAGSLTGIIAIGASEYRGLALRNDGAVFAWGDYALGNGTNNTSYTPVQVVGVGGVGLLGGVTAIAQGYNHSLALLSNGTVVSWGENQYGQLGDGTFTDRLSPVQVLAPGGGGPLMGVTAIATSGHHSMALLSTGVVVAWGFNPDGELGNGTTTPNAPFGIPTAVQVSNLSGVTAIAASGDNGFAIKADTSLVA